MSHRRRSRDSSWRRGHPDGVCWQGCNRFLDGYAVRSTPSSHLAAHSRYSPLHLLFTSNCLHPPLPQFLRSLRARSGHIQEEIFEAIDSRDPGELSDLGLEALPVIVGRADGEAPASAKGAGFPSTNWAGNILWSASEVALPESVEELQALVAAAAGRVRCVGRSHSFTPAADTGWSASLNDFKKWIHYQ